VSSLRNPDTTRDHVQDCGLIYGHSYSVLDTREFRNDGLSEWDGDETLRLVCLRNPWGKGEWTGEWSDDSDMWRKYPQLAKELEVDNVDNGKFWMSFDDFTDTFRAVHINQATADCELFSAGVNLYKSDKITRRKSRIDGVTKEEKADSKVTGILLRGRKKKDEGYKKEEITQLREAIQMLCQTTNPLAKCMDQLQEDMENMHKELNFWNTEKKTFASKHREEERATIDELNQMGSLQELDDEIASAREKTNSIKAQILRNDETIARLLSLVVTGSG